MLPVTVQTKTYDIYEVLRLRLGSVIVTFTFQGNEQETI